MIIGRGVSGPLAQPSFSIARFTWENGALRIPRRLGEAFGWQNNAFFCHETGILALAPDAVNPAEPCRNAARPTQIQRRSNADLAAIQHGSSRQKSLFIWCYSMINSRHANSYLPYVGSRILALRLQRRRFGARAMPGAGTASESPFGPRGARPSARPCGMLTPPIHVLALEAAEEAPRMRFTRRCPCPPARCGPSPFPTATSRSSSPVPS